MNNKAVAALVVAALIIGVVAGLTLAGDGENDTTSGPGPTNVVAGVPVGYERSPEGAARAALGFEATLADLRTAPPSARRAALEVIALPERVEQIGEASDDAYAFFDHEFGTEGVVRSVVVGYQLKAYDKDAAEVELWEVSVVGRPGSIPARSGWSTRILRLRWADDDWKIAELPSEVSGPTPQLQEPASTSEEVIEAARRFEEVRYAPAP